MSKREVATDPYISALKIKLAEYTALLNSTRDHLHELEKSVAKKSERLQRQQITALERGQKLSGISENEDSTEDENAAMVEAQKRIKELKAKRLTLIAEIGEAESYHTQVPTDSNSSSSASSSSLSSSSSSLSPPTNLVISAPSEASQRETNSEDDVIVDVRDFKGVKNQEKPATKNDTKENKKEQDKQQSNAPLPLNTNQKAPDSLEFVRNKCTFAEGIETQISPALNSGKESFEHAWHHARMSTKNEAKAMHLDIADNMNIAIHESKEVLEYLKKEGLKLHVLMLTETGEKSHRVIDRDNITPVFDEKMGYSDPSIIHMVYHCQSNTYFELRVINAPPLPRVESDPNFKMSLINEYTEITGLTRLSILQAQASGKCLINQIPTGIYNTPNPNPLDENTRSVALNLSQQTQSYPTNEFLVYEFHREKHDFLDQAFEDSYKNAIPPSASLIMLARIDKQDKAAAFFIATNTAFNARGMIEENSYVFKAARPLMKLLFKTMAVTHYWGAYFSTSERYLREYRVVGYRTTILSEIRAKQAWLLSWPLTRPLSLSLFIISNVFDRLQVLVNCGVAFNTRLHYNCNMDLFDDSPPQEENKDDEKKNSDVDDTKKALIGSMHDLEAPKIKLRYASGCTIFKNTIDATMHLAVVAGGLYLLGNAERGLFTLSDNLGINLLLGYAISGIGARAIHKLTEASETAYQFLFFRNYLNERKVAIEPKNAATTPAGTAAPLTENQSPPPQLNPTIPNVDQSTPRTSRNPTTSRTPRTPRTVRTPTIARLPKEVRKTTGPRAPIRSHRPPPTLAPR